VRDLLPLARSAQEQCAAQQDEKGTERRNDSDASAPSLHLGLICQFVAFPRERASRGRS